MSRESSTRLVPLGLAAFLVLGVLTGLPASHDPVAQDKLRESELCLECHTGLDTTLVRTAHRVGAEGAAMAACTDCHPGDRRHWEDDPAKFPMTNPSKVGATAEARVCASCHQNAHQQNMLEKNVHPTNEVSCSGCHTVHAAKHPSLLKKPQQQLCMDCHVREAAQFARPYRHPVAEGVVQCTDCHTQIDRTSRTLSNNGENVCMNCHGEFAGPFPFQHQATLGHSTEEGGCMTCHDPHGSALPRMLKQPYEPPHQQLCTQCHSVPRHYSNSMHGTSFANVSCNSCHTDIHGSYDNRLFVNESMRAQGCFNSGCHRN